MWGNEKLSLCVRSDQVSHPHSQAVGFGGKRRENLGKFEAIREEEVQGQRFFGYLSDGILCVFGVILWTDNFQQRVMTTSCSRIPLAHN